MRIFFATLAAILVYMAFKVFPFNLMGASLAFLLIMVISEDE